MQDQSTPTLFSFLLRPSLQERKTRFRPSGIVLLAQDALFLHFYWPVVIYTLCSSSVSRVVPTVVHASPVH
jgi:uncharacterized membrane protein (DUF106 family)